MKEKKIKDQVETQEVSKEDCYLQKTSKEWKAKYGKLINDDKLVTWNELLNDANVKMSDEHQNMIREFTIPYKISPLKWMLNNGYYKDPLPADFHYNHMHIAPTLKILKENPSYIAMGYPSWFIICFPDVAYWAMIGNGNAIIKSNFKKIEEKDLIDGNHIRKKWLNEIIKLYQESTRKTLECQIY